MRINILIGGKAGQGINKVSGIVSKTLIDYGYFVFNYRDYPSIIRGGHNFNLLSISDEQIESHESKLDGIIALDSDTIKIHKKELRKSGFVIDFKNFISFGINMNIALSGALMKILGIEKNFLLDQVKKSLENKASFKQSLEAMEKGYESQQAKYHLKKLQSKPYLLTGNKGVALGAINSKLDVYFAYPMTPTTNALHELSGLQEKYGHLTFQPESEISVANMALGASFAGAKVMIASSGGGYDLMTEAISFQGMSEIPLTVYLGSRGGPSTGLPTYTMQGDLDLALRSGHGEFPRVVIAPGNPKECIEKTNEAIYLSQKFNVLSILLSDKHLAECEFSSNENINKPLKIFSNRSLPGGREVVKASGYEYDVNGITTEDAKITVENAQRRLEKYKKIKEECKKFEMIKIHGKKDSKNLIIGWGSTRGAILDAVKGLDFKFLQVIYMKPLSDKIKQEIEKSKKVVLVEQNLTGQLGRLIREKTGIKIEKRILKYDGRPFTSDELRKELMKLR
ncbi:2-oxoacid:acceptor oxidoreductase family protein [Candidatus Pacearchaeota archaeon]|nr:2-oxoacid:acceptor oxidoreductase family protein [Candidatus Pacearchaeota archaeon]